MNGKTALTALVALAGAALIVIAVIYWIEPAGSLPVFFPGHQSGSSHHHTTHGIAAFVVGVLLLILAWFRTGPRSTDAGE